jgi:hypothetical protein
MPNCELDKGSVKYVKERISQRLPIKDDADIEYCKERMFWIIDRFKEEFFRNAIQFETDSILDLMFIIIKKECADSEYFEFDEFVVLLASTMKLVVEKFGCKLKVSLFFFVTVFRTIVDSRYLHQRASIMYYQNFFVTALVNVGIEISEVPAILEKSMEWAETNPKYDYYEEDYLGDLANEVVRICHDRGKEISLDILNPLISKRGSNNA